VTARESLPADLAAAHALILAERAARLEAEASQMIQLSSDIDLQIVDCSCRPGTAGTIACNYGRACGYLTIDGQDAGDVLIAENLAHPLMCGEYSCPHKQSWCPLVSGTRGAEE
jgi:DNA-binding GntR family transcriptional regulator